MDVPCLAINPIYCFICMMLNCSTKYQWQHGFLSFPRIQTLMLDKGEGREEKLEEMRGKKNGYRYN